MGFWFVVLEFSVLVTRYETDFFIFLYFGRAVLSNLIEPVAQNVNKGRVFWCPVTGENLARSFYENNFNKK